MPVDAPTPSPAAKGRPTPKRRDAGPRRGPVAPAPKTRREAMARQRAQAKAAPSKSSTMTAAERRRRMLDGDVSALPRREAGPVRALARDYVDSRLMLSNGLLLIVPLLLLSYLVKFLNVIVWMLFLLVLLEWITAGRRVMTLAAQRGLDPGRDKALSLGMYIGTRSYLPRRWRLPRPRVARGAQI